MLYRRDNVPERTPYRTRSTSPPPHSIVFICCLTGLVRLATTQHSFRARRIRLVCALTRAHPSTCEWLQQVAHLARSHTPAITNGFEAVDAGRASPWHRYRVHLWEPIA
jgi:hypothetical protein